MTTMRWASALAMAAGLLVTTAQAQEAKGDWHGVLKVGPTELRIGVVIAAGPDGALAGQITSPDQGPGAMPLSEVRVEAGKLSFAAPAIRGRYEGAWNAAQGGWVGSWTQAAPLPLTLLAGPVPAQPRPQVPTKPYPYREEEVGFDSAPGVKLAGTLTLPPGKGPFPAVVLISGSGAQDRDESLLGHKPFLVLADHLTRRGIAVLRYDDRGFAKSTGVFQTATSADFATDAEAAAAFLRARPDIDAAKIGLVGHSEGGLVAPMVAAKDPKIAFLVLLAAPGVPSRALMAAQRAAIMAALGAPPEAITRAQALATRVDDAVLAAATPEAARAEVTRLLTEAGGEITPAAAQMQAGLIGTPWYREFIGYDPAPALSQVRVPVLALNGGKDMQVVASQNLPGVRAALSTDRDVTVTELPGLNHLFQTAPTGSPQEYGRIEETMSPTALNAVSDWITAQTKR
ncbi:MAG: alpha/beta hydrolase [Caulobacterales bacterium]|nr:alpha/beta hydrolase [Caulobacterales bacterium]